MSVTDVDEMAAMQAVADRDLPRGWRVEILGDQLVVNPPADNIYNEVAFETLMMLRERMPPGLRALPQGEGVWRSRQPQARYTVPDGVIYDRTNIPPGEKRIIGTDVIVVIEVISESNRRLSNYASQVAEDDWALYGIEWLLAVDPDRQQLQWFHQGSLHPTGPEWAGTLGWNEIAARLPW